MTQMFDYSELVDLTDDMDKAAALITPEVAKVIAKGSLNIKTGWQRLWSGYPHIKRIPRTISYDVTTTPALVSSDIGPDKSRGSQAHLATLIEYGSVHNAPIPGGAPALAAEAPRTEQALADLAERLIL